MERSVDSFLEAVLHFPQVGRAWELNLSPQAWLMSLPAEPSPTLLNHFCYPASQEQIILSLHFWKVKLVTLAELDSFKDLLGQAKKCQSVSHCVFL